MTSLAAKFCPTWLPKLLLATLAPLVFLGGLELVLRVGSFGRDTRFFIPESAEFYRTNPRFTELVFPASFGLKPVNFRITQHKRGGVKRIFLIGESAAMGVPEPGFGMGPQLEAILRDVYSGEDIEVYNLGIAAINSHAILPIVRQAVEFEPDLLIFYMGNNEMVGPFWPGAAITDSSPPFSLVHLKPLAENLSYWPARGASDSKLRMSRVAQPKLARYGNVYRKDSDFGRSSLGCSVFEFWS